MRAHVSSARRPIRRIAVLVGLTSCGALAVAAYGRVRQAPSRAAMGTAAPPAAAPGLSSDDGIPVVGWEAGAVRVPSSPDAWGGQRQGNEATLSERVASY